MVKKVKWSVFQCAARGCDGCSVCKPPSCTRAPFMQAVLMCRDCPQDTDACRLQLRRVSSLDLVQALIPDQGKEILIRKRNEMAHKGIYVGPFDAGLGEQGIRIQDRDGYIVHFWPHHSEIKRNDNWWDII